MGRERTPLCSGNKIDIYGVQLNSEFHGHVGSREHTTGGNKYTSGLSGGLPPTAD